MKHPLSLLCAMLLGLSALNAQHFSITFRISDPNGNPLHGAAISLSSGTVNAVSDSLGVASVIIKTSGTSYNITVLGYQSVSGMLFVNSDTVISFLMQSNPIELPESVINANSQANNETSSLNVNVANAEILKRTQGITLTQTLEKSSGITSMNIGAGITKPFLRGMGFNRLAVVDHGIKQQGQQWGADHGLEIDAFNVGSVIIVKGPSSLRYGSDAMAGVINIRPASLPESNSLQSEISLQGMSVNTLLGGSAAFAVNRDQFYTASRVTYKNYGDYAIPADSFYYNGWKLPIHDRKLKNTAGRETDASFTAGYHGKKIVTAITLTGYWLKAGFFSGAHGLPGFRNTLPDTGYRDIDFPFQEVTHYKVVINSILNTHPGEISLDIGYQQNIRKERSYPHSHGRGPQPSGNLELMFRLQTFSLNAGIERTYNDKSSGEFGICSEYQTNKHDGYLFLLPDFNQLNVGVYSLQQYQPFKKWNFNAGIRFDYFRISVKSYLEPVYFSPDSISGYIRKSPDLLKNSGNVTFTTGLAWEPTDGWNIKFNIGTGFRIPSAVELASNGIHHGSFRYESGDSLLNPEHSYQADLGVYLQTRSIRMSITPFVTYIDDYIYLKPTGTFSPLAEAGQLYKYSAANALMAGTEAEVSYSILKWLSLNIQAQYVFGQNLDDGYPLPFIPPIQIHPSLNVEINSAKSSWFNFYFEFSAWYNTRQYRTARNESITPPSFTLDISAGTSILKNNNKISFRIHATNLLNTDYFNHISFYRIINLPESGRNIGLIIQWNFNKPFKIKYQ